MVHVVRRHVADGFVQPLVVVVLDEASEGPPPVAGKAMWPTVVIPPASAAERSRSVMPSKRISQRGTPTRISERKRSILARITGNLTPDLDWTANTDGQHTAALTFRAKGAISLRIAVQAALPSGASVQVFDGDGQAGSLWIDGVERQGRIVSPRGVRWVFVLAGELHPGHLDERATQSDAQVRSHPAVGFRKIVVRVERKVRAVRSSIDTSALDTTVPPLRASMGVPS